MFSIGQGVFEGTQFRAPEQSVQEIYGKVANLFGGSRLTVAEGISVEVSRRALKAVIEVCDSLGDPDFDGPVREMNARETERGSQNEPLSISIIDLGLLGDVTIGGTDAAPSLKVVLNVTSIRCPFKQEIKREVSKQLAAKLGEECTVEARDQYEDFIRTFFARMGLDNEDIAQFVSDYHNSPSGDTLTLMQDFAEVVLNEAAERGDTSTIEEISLHVHGRFSQHDSINPASIPEDRVERFERFVELARRYPNIPFLAGGLMRAMPIVHHARAYHDEARTGQLGTVGTPEHATKANKWIKARENNRLEGARRKR